MTWVAIFAIGILAVTAVIGVFRLYTARDDASIAAVSDLVYFCGIGMVALGAVIVCSSITMDVLAIGSLLGILATVALSRILTRGRR